MTQDNTLPDTEEARQSPPTAEDIMCRSKHNMNQTVSSSGSSTSGTMSTSSSTCGRAVQFKDKVETIPVEIDLRGRKEKWYGKSDYKRFQDEKKETLRHFRQAQAKFERIDEAVYCLRGLEPYLSARAVQQKLLRKVAASQAVMEMQFKQRRRGVYHPRKIQMEYYHVTTPARNQALERAAMDAREVLEDADQNDNNSNLQQNQEEQGASDDAVVLKNEFDRLMALNSGHCHPTLRSATSGPLRLRKTVPNTA